MSNQAKVAVLVDVENMQWGLRNNYGVDFRPQDVMDNARRFGHIKHARAFGNFDELPPHTWNLLNAAGFDPVHVPRENGKSYTDFEMLVDIFQTAIDMPDIRTYVIATGDGHFVKVIAKLRNQMEKRVIGLGIRGTINDALYQATDELIVIEPETRLERDVDINTVKTDLINYLDEIKEKVNVLTFKKTVDAFSQVKDYPLPYAHNAMVKLINEKAVIQEIVDYAGGKSRILKLNYSHPRVMEALHLGSRSSLTDRPPVREQLVRYLEQAEDEYEFLTFLPTVNAFSSTYSGLGWTQDETKDALSAMISDGLVVQEMIRYKGDPVRTIRLNREHQEVQNILKVSPSLG